MAKMLDKKTQPGYRKGSSYSYCPEPNRCSASLEAPPAISATASDCRHVRTAIAAGANFDSVAVRVSDDPGSKFRGGVYDSITRQTQFVPEFKDFAFNNPAGTKGVVKTQFGYHYIEVMSQRGNSPVYQVAFFALPIEASPETVSEASNGANMLAGTAKDEKKLQTNILKRI
jgi:peptidyl-prolyl cis-trans isomerase D